MDKNVACMYTDISLIFILKSNQSLKFLNKVNYSKTITRKLTKTIFRNLRINLL